MEEAKAFDLQLRHALRQVEIVGPQLPDSVASRLPAVIAMPAMGLTLKVDDTPNKNTLELGINVQGLERFLGIGELKADQKDFRNEVWTVLGALKQQIESHLALIQEYRKEAVGSRSFMENAVLLLNRLEGLLEGKGGLV
jgi:hypothetical protein